MRLCEGHLANIQNDYRIIWLVQMNSYREKSHTQPLAQFAAGLQLAAVFVDSVTRLLDILAAIFSRDHERLGETVERRER